MSEKDNPILKYKEAEIASEYSDEAIKNAWEALREVAQKCSDSAAFMNLLKPLEDNYMDTMYAKVPEAKFKDGRWKYAKFQYTDGAGVRRIGGLPKAYRSAKSVLKNSIANGFDITNRTSKYSLDVRLRNAKSPAERVQDLAKDLTLALASMRPSQAKDLWDVYIEPINPH